MELATFSGRAVGGRFVFDGGLPIWQEFLRQHEGMRLTIEVMTEGKRRSLRANRYYFGVVVEFFRSIWSKPRVRIHLPPYTKIETHSVLVQALCGSRPGPLDGTVLPVWTHTMNTKTFAKLVDDARQLAWDEYQSRIPEPNEGWDE